MPVEFSEVDAVPDILATDRFSLYFPTIADADGYDLLIRNVSVQLPTESIGHIKKRYLGHPIGFAGGVTTDNQITCEFYEDRAATITKAFTSWMKIIRDKHSRNGGLRREYSANGKLKAYDTVGKAAIVYTLYNMFPVSMQHPDYGEGSSPAKVSVVFNVDAVDIDDSAMPSHSTGKTRTSNAIYGGSSAFHNTSTNTEFPSGAGLGISGTVNLGGFTLSANVSLVLPQTALTFSQFASSLASMFSF